MCKDFMGQVCSHFQKKIQIGKFIPEKNIYVLFTVFTLLFSGLSVNVSALDPSHFSITRTSAPYFVVDGNNPTTLTKAYVSFEVKNTSAVTYQNLVLAVSSIGTSVTGQNYTILSPASNKVVVGTLAPNQSKVCYFFVQYPPSVTPQATFNLSLTDATATGKTAAIVIRNRSSISANAGGLATQSFLNQDALGGIIVDTITYTVGNSQNGDELDFQVAVAAQFDPTKMQLIDTRVVASTVPGIPVGATDSLYFVSGNGSTGASVRIAWRFRITSYNFTNYILPYAGATSGATNYKYALSTDIGSGTPVTISSTANPLTITKAANKTYYLTCETATFTLTVSNPGAYGVSIDSIKDQLPAGFSYVAFTGSSGVTTTNSVSYPAAGSTGNIAFVGGISSGANTSYFVPAGGSVQVIYTATAPCTPASNLGTTAGGYVGSTLFDNDVNTVYVVDPSSLPVQLLSFSGTLANRQSQLQWRTSTEINAAYYVVERSNDGRNFTAVGQVQASGNSSFEKRYSFTDAALTGTIYFYRLKMIDNDGSIGYSSIVKLQQNPVQKIIVSPNPFTSTIQINATVEESGVADIRLLDQYGRVVYQTVYTVVAGTNSIQLTKLPALPAAHYLLQWNSNGRTYTEKMMKQ